MQYILLMYQGPDWAERGKAEKDRISDECAQWRQELIKNGRSRANASFRPVATATTVRESRGRATVADGPCEETKETLGGFEIVECRDLDEAIAVAKRYPALRVGFAVEVRPLMTDAQEEE